MSTALPPVNERLYHGTRAPFRGKGGLLLPGDTCGRDNHGLDRSGVVYVTPDLDLAWDYARAARGRGKPRVLIVAPDGRLTVDDSTVNGCEQEAYTCEAAIVLDVLTHDPEAAR